MYTLTNYKTKKQLKLAVASGAQETIFRPNSDVTGFTAAAESPNYSGPAFICGPHSPQPHRWYATVYVENGIIVKVK